MVDAFVCAPLRRARQAVRSIAATRSRVGRSVGASSPPINAAYGIGVICVVPFTIRGEDSPRTGQGRSM